MGNLRDNGISYAIEVPCPAGLSCQKAQGQPGYICGSGSSGAASQDSAAEDTVPSDWQVYIHTSPTFKFKHPTNYQVDVSKNPTMGQLEFVTAYLGEDTFGASCSLGVKLWDSPLTADQDYSESHASQKSTVTIDGRSAKKYFAPASSQVPRNVYDYFLDEPQQGMYMNINLVENKGSSCLDTLDKMLSSFKFSN
jgi:hypothetical protein